MAHLHNLGLVKFRDTLCFNLRTTGARKARNGFQVSRAMPPRWGETRFASETIIRITLGAGNATCQVALWSANQRYIIHYNVQRIPRYNEKTQSLHAI